MLDVVSSEKKKKGDSTKLWKSLPQDYLKAKSLLRFKGNHKKFKKEISIENFKICRNFVYLKKNLCHKSLEAEYSWWKYYVCLPCS